MKATFILIVTLALSWQSLQAQPQDERERNQSSSTQQQQSGEEPESTTDRQQINEPAGAERPQGRAFSTNDLPPGRAFSTNNPPQGQPFEEGNRPPGRPFREPSGAENTQTNSQGSVETGTPDESGSTEREQGSQAQPEAKDQQGSVQHESAGAQRDQSQKLSTAFQSNQKTQIEQAIKASIVTSGSTKVPEEFVTRLSSDLSTTLTKIQITEEQRVKLAQSIHVILNAQPANQAEVQEAFRTVHTTLVQSGEVTPLAQASVCDLHLIATQLVPGLQLDLPGAAVRVK